MWVDESGPLPGPNSLLLLWIVLAQLLFSWCVLQLLTGDSLVKNFMATKRFVRAIIYMFLDLVIYDCCATNYYKINCLQEWVIVVSVSSLVDWAQLGGSCLGSLMR